MEEKQDKYEEETEHKDVKTDYETDMNDIIATFRVDYV